MRDQNQSSHRGSGFNRRDFLKGSGAAVAATAIATGAAEEVQAQGAKKPNVVAAGVKKITLNVNGTDRTVAVEPRAILLDVLRNDFDLTGCKDVDDRTASGADTVIIDGKPVLAGSRLAIQCVGQKIETVESLSGDGKTDEVIAGFVKHDAMQCGFCTPGFVMATRAFLNKNPAATLKEIQ
ncbi:MAG: twin-arginine translocation signal domain-containing protein [candidate division Zixibacteria bacterium]|nr:twin-arginine translocation signal domain-containing protein [candidate division Zixibacteria bacterium]